MSKWIRGIVLHDIVRDKLRELGVLVSVRTRYDGDAPIHDVEVTHGDEELVNGEHSVKLYPNARLHWSSTQEEPTLQLTIYSEGG